MRYGQYAAGVALLLGAVGAAQVGVEVWGVARAPQAFVRSELWAMLIRAIASSAYLLLARRLVRDCRASLTALVVLSAIQVPFLEAPTWHYSCFVGARAVVGASLDGQVFLKVSLGNEVVLSHLPWIGVRPRGGVNAIAFLVLLGLLDYARASRRRGTGRREAEDSAGGV